MNCQLCMQEFLSGKSQVPPAEAEFIIHGAYVPFPMALCRDHANPGEYEEGGAYVATPITSSLGQELLTQITRGK